MCIGCCFVLSLFLPVLSSSTRSQLVCRFLCHPLPLNSPSCRKRGTCGHHLASRRKESNSRVEWIEFPDRLSVSSFRAWSQTACRRCLLSGTGILCVCCLSDRRIRTRSSMSERLRSRRLLSFHPMHAWVAASFPICRYVKRQSLLPKFDDSWKHEAKEYWRLFSRLVLLCLLSCPSCLKVLCFVRVFSFFPVSRRLSCTTVAKAVKRFSCS